MANAPLLKKRKFSKSLSEIISKAETYANPNAIIPQIPNFTRLGSLIFHKNMIGKIERIRSVAAAIAIDSSSVQNCWIKRTEEAYILGQFLCY